MSEKTITLEFTLTEIDCIVRAVGRDQERTLDEFFRRDESALDGLDKRTRLLTRAEMDRVPFHQAVLCKIEEVLND